MNQIGQHWFYTVQNFLTKRPSRDSTPSKCVLGRHQIDSEGDPDWGLSIYVIQRGRGEGELCFTACADCPCSIVLAEAL